MALLISSPTHGQVHQLHIEKIPNELGLSQNLISCITQDTAGIMWLGTPSGLNKFDGYQFEVIKAIAGDTMGLAHSEVLTLHTDSRGWLWVGSLTALQIYNHADERFYTLDGVVTGDFQSICEDAYGQIWIIGRNRTLYRINPCDDLKDIENHKISAFTGLINYSNPNERKFQVIRQDDEGNLWLGNYASAWKISNLTDPEPEMIKVFDIYRTPMLQVPDGTVSEIIGEEPEKFEGLYTRNAGGVWFLFNNGLGSFSPKEKKFTFHASSQIENGQNISVDLVSKSGMEDDQGRLWIGGLLKTTNMVIDTRSMELIAYSAAHDEVAVPGLDGGIIDIYEDDSGLLWFGTNGHGLFKLNPNQRPLAGKPWASVFPGGSIYPLFETADGNIWTSVYFETGDEIETINSSTGENHMVAVPQYERAPIGIPGRHVPYARSFAWETDTTFWAAGIRSLYHVAYEDGSIISIKEHSISLQHNSVEARKSDEIRAIHLDDGGRLWILSGYEFGYYDNDTGEFRGSIFTEPILEEQKVNSGSLIQQNDSIFWIGSERGLFRYTPSNQFFEEITSPGSNPLSSSDIKSICLDPVSPEKYLWVGTSDHGLNRLNLTTGEVIVLGLEDGMPDEMIYGILPSNDGHIWSSTNKGLVRVNVRTLEIWAFTKNDGLQDWEFNSQSYHKCRDGRLMFGGIKGLNVFHPDSISDSNYEPAIAFTGFSANAEKMDFHSHPHVMSEPLNIGRSVVLDHDQRMFTIEFAALDLANSQKNQYAYWLENFDQDWQQLANVRKMTFTNLDAGEYVFKLKASNSSGVWGKRIARLNITILPPWWATWWAYLMYTLVVASIIITVYRYQLKRRIAGEETRRLRELDTLKSRLYANITHEFRTPLTVIMGMNENIEGHTKQKNLIRRNAENLLRLINQLLDLSKIDSGRMKLNMVRGDIVSYTRYLIESFQSAATDKGIALEFSSSEASIEMDFDEAQVQHVAYNLLSNALKFTEEGGRVDVNISTQQENTLVLEVRDTGVGIDAEDQSMIFDRFYQADNTSTRKSEGTGIGLALTREIVEMLNGEISVLSELGQGTHFIIKLPIIRQSNQVSKPMSPIKEVEANPLYESNGDTNQSADLPLLLLVEDNPDVATYIGDLVRDRYQFVHAPDGQKGVDKAIELIPDVIISDVMMPNKDGYELTEELKNDERTSHIPIILLTAKSLQEEKVLGLRKGADAYLNKPFDKEELFVRLNKLVELRRLLVQKFKGTTAVDLVQMKEPTVEEKFLQKVTALITEHMGDADFNIQMLEDELGLSKMQFYRKVKALTDLSPTNFIRDVRLDTAKNLINTSDHTVSEIAYEVGFSDPAYFSRAFKSKFGSAPSEVRN